MILSQPLIFRYQGYPFRHCSRTDQPISGIFRIVDRELSPDCSNLRTNWQDYYAGTSQEILYGTFHRGLTPNDSTGEQQGQFPNCNRRDCNAFAHPRPADCRRSLSGEPLWVSDHPNEHVAVKQDQRSASQCSGGTKGAITSPTISISPLRQPKIS